MSKLNLIDDLIDLIDGACPLVPLMLVEIGNTEAKYRDEDDLTEVGCDETRRAAWQQFEVAREAWDEMRGSAIRAVYDHGLGAILMGRGDVRYW